MAPRKCRNANWDLHGRGISGVLVFIVRRVGETVHIGCTNNSLAWTIASFQTQQLEMIQSHSLDNANGANYVFKQLFESCSTQP